MAIYCTTAELIDQIAHTDNGKMVEIRNLLATRSPTYRARVIERLSSMIGAIAEHDAEALSEPPPDVADAWAMAAYKAGGGPEEGMLEALAQSKRKRSR